MFPPSARIYVAGHRGLVGSAIVRRLKHKGFDNLLLRTSRELDLRDQAEVEAFFAKERPEYVFLAAAKVGGILANDTYKAEFIYDNLMIAANVIHASHEYGVKKLLNLGSSCIYPRCCPQPMKEEHLLTGTLESTNEPYAMAKIVAIKLCRYYNQQYSTRFISVMPTNLYGPNDNFNLETAHVLPALIRKFHLARLLRQGDYEGIQRDLNRFTLGFGHHSPLSEKEATGDPMSPSALTPSPFMENDQGGAGPSPSSFKGEGPGGDQSRSSQDEAPGRPLERLLSHFGITKDYVVLWGTGNPCREFLHVDDLAEACVFLMEEVDTERMKAISPDYFVNVGVGNDIRIKDLAFLVKDIVGFEGGIRYDISRPDGTPRKLLDVSKIKALGWRPRISLEEGIKRSCEWYLHGQTNKTAVNANFSTTLLSGICIPK